MVGRVEIRDIEVGAVSTRKGARLHLSVAGVAYCGSGSGHIITAHAVSRADSPLICGKCRKALRRALTDVAEVRGRRALGDLRGSRTNTLIVAECDALIDAMESPEERAERAALFAEMERSLAESLAESYAAAISPRPITEVVDALMLF